MSIAVVTVGKSSNFVAKYTNKQQFIQLSFIINLKDISCMCKAM